MKTSHIIDQSHAFGGSVRHADVVKVMSAESVMGGSPLRAVCAQKGRRRTGVLLPFTFLKVGASSLLCMKITKSIVDNSELSNSTVVIHSGLTRFPGEGF